MLNWGRVGVLLVLIGSPLSAAEQQPDADNEGPGLVATMDTMQKQVSRRVVVLGRRLDLLLGGTRGDLETKGSLLRLGTTAVIDEDETGWESHSRFKLALPRTRERLSLLVESEQDDPFSQTRNRGQPTTRGAPDRGYTAGLNYLEVLADRWNADVDTGVRVRSPVEPFVRLGLRRDVPVEDWQVRFSPSLFWYRSRGQGATGELQVQRSFESSRLGRSVSWVTWLDRAQRFDYGQDFLLMRQLQHKRALVYQLGLRGVSEPNHHLDHAFLNLRFRSRIGRDWLYIEVRPEVLHRRENGFAPEPRLFLTLEALFGDLRRAQ